jgi:hypothetical protein
MRGASSAQDTDGWSRAWSAGLPDAQLEKCRQRYLGGRWRGGTEWRMPTSSTRPRRSVNRSVTRKPATLGVIDAHIEKQPPINGHEWSLTSPESRGDMSQHGIKASGMALVLAMPVLSACPILLHGATMSDTTADADIGMACAAPAKAGIW